MCSCRVLASELCIDHVKDFLVDLNKIKSTLYFNTVKADIVL